MIRWQFKVGDRIWANVGGKVTMTGTVIRMYNFEGQRRHVVHFDDGDEGVFFDYELLAQCNPRRKTFEDPLNASNTRPSF